MVNLELKNKLDQSSIVSHGRQMDTSSYRELYKKLDQISIVPKGR